MSNSTDKVIEELQESLLRLNKKIHKMCLSLESTCAQETGKDSDRSYERESKSDQIKTKL